MSSKLKMIALTTIVLTCASAQEPLPVEFQEPMENFDLPNAMKIDQLSENQEMLANLRGIDSDFLNSIVNDQDNFLDKLSTIDQDIANNLRKIIDEDPDFFVQLKTYVETTQSTSYGEGNNIFQQLSEFDAEVINTLTSNKELFETLNQAQLNAQKLVTVEPETIGTGTDTSTFVEQGISIFWKIMAIVGIGLAIFGICCLGYYCRNKYRSRRRKHDQVWNRRRLIQNTPIRRLTAQLGIDEINKIGNDEPKPVQSATETTSRVDEILAIENIEYYAGFSCLTQIAWCALGYYLYKRCTQQRKEHKVERLNAIHF